MSDASLMMGLYTQASFNYVLAHPALLQTMSARQKFTEQHKCWETT